MNLETIAQQGQSGGLDQSRALKNAVLLRKLQSMDPETRQRVIAMAQQKRRARMQPQSQPQQMQQRQPIPQGQLQQRQPIQPQQMPQRQPMPQGGQINATTAAFISAAVTTAATNREIKNGFFR